MCSRATALATLVAILVLYVSVRLVCGREHPLRGEKMAGEKARWTEKPPASSAEGLISNRRQHLLLKHIDLCYLSY